jgi:hypothetical protein
LKATRDWAKSSGWTVSDGGRLPSNVVEAYDAAHKLETCAVWRRGLGGDARVCSPIRFARY